MCPACGAQYLAWVTRCADCGVALLDAGPSVLDLPDDEQLVYELAEWTPARRTLLESLLGADGIGHAWEASDLVVHVDDESRVDALVDAIEQGGVAGAATAEQAGLDGDQLVYELDAWSVDDRHKLGEALLEAGREANLREGATLLEVGAGNGCAARAGTAINVLAGRASPKSIEPLGEERRARSSKPRKSCS
jgi:hypothetical protein